MLKVVGLKECGSGAPVLSCWPGLHLRAPPGAQRRRTALQDTPALPLQHLLVPAHLRQFLLESRDGLTAWGAVNPAQTPFCLCFPAGLLTGSFLWCRKHTELSRSECQHLTCVVLPLKQLQQQLEFEVLPLTQTQHPQ